jgi:hypothetical protein
VGNGNETIGEPEMVGTFEFGADGQFTYETTSTVHVTWVYTDLCLEAVGVAGTTAADRCTGLTREHQVCEYAPDACRCVADPMIENDAGGGPYSVDGDELVLGEDPPSTYCVDGDRLIMDYYLIHPISWRYWAFERL